jgi:hypothetical protein
MPPVVAHGAIPDGIDALEQVEAEVLAARVATKAALETKDREALAAAHAAETASVTEAVAVAAAARAAHLVAVANHAALVAEAANKAATAAAHDALVAETHSMASAPAPAAIPDVADMFASWATASTPLETEGNLVSVGQQGPREAVFPPCTPFEEDLHSCHARGPAARQAILSTGLATSGQEFSPLSHSADGAVPPYGDEPSDHLALCPSGEASVVGMDATTAPFSPSDAQAAAFGLSSYLTHHVGQAHPVPAASTCSHDLPPPASMAPDSCGVNTASSSHQIGQSSAAAALIATTAASSCDETERSFAATRCTLSEHSGGARAGRFTSVAGSHSDGSATARRLVADGQMLWRCAQILFIGAAILMLGSSSVIIAANMQPGSILLKRTPPTYRHVPSMDPPVQPSRGTSPHSKGKLFARSTMVDLCEDAINTESCALRVGRPQSYRSLVPPKVLEEWRLWYSWGF